MVQNVTFFHFAANLYMRHLLDLVTGLDSVIQCDKKSLDPLWLMVQCHDILRQSRMTSLFR